MTRMCTRAHTHPDEAEVEGEAGDQDVHEGGLEQEHVCGLDEGLGEEGLLASRAVGRDPFGCVIKQRAQKRDRRGHGLELRKGSVVKPMMCAKKRGGMTYQQERCRRRSCSHIW